MLAFVAAAVAMVMAAICLGAIVGPVEQMDWKGERAAAI
jgi:hypothetical protein